MSGDKPSVNGKSTPKASSSSSSSTGSSKLISLLLVATLGAVFGVCLRTYQLGAAQGEELPKLVANVDEIRRLVSEINANVKTLKAESLAPAAAAKEKKINAADLAPGAKPAASSSDGDASDPDVVVLTESNWDTEVTYGEQSVTFIEFYAPWCGHCKKLAPDWQKLAAHFNRQPELGAKICKLDATVEKELAKRYDVTGFPSLKLFIKGIDTPKDYSGERTYDALQRYIDGQTGPAFVELKSGTEVAQFQEKNSLAVIGFVEAESLDGTMFRNVANDQREKMRFGMVSDRALAEQLAVSTFPMLRVHRHFDRKKPAEYTGSFVDSAAIISFLTDASIPFWGELTMENAQSYLATKRPLAVLFVGPETLRTPGLVIDPLIPTAKKYEGKLTFVYLSNDKFASHRSRLGLDEKRLPAFAVDDQERSWKYPLLDDVNAANLDKFLDDWTNGRLVSHVRSAPVPESNDEPVKVVVGNTFDEIVLNNDKDVLVEFYAPWCGHCKTLEPKYAELAEKLKGVDSLVIAKIDATQNDAPPQTGIAVRGFPTIYFFPGNAKDKPIVYERGREVDEFISFLKEKSSTKFEL